MIMVAGEALYDVFPQMGSDDPSKVPLMAVTGGSPFNVACALGRLGFAPQFFGGIAQGQLGDRQFEILEAAQVSGDAVVRKPNLVPMMVITLAPDGQPTYNYYGQGTADVEITSDDLLALPAMPNLLHLGSYSLVMPPIADTLAMLVDQLPESSLLTVDPNVRPMVEPDVDVWRARLAPLFQRADIIKLSDEDIAFLEPEASVSDYARTLHRLSGAPVFLTRGHEGVTVVFGDGEQLVTAPKVDVVDTVGAGDSFQSTLIAWASRPDVASAIRTRTVTMPDLVSVAEAAVAVAARICRQQGPVVPEVDALSEAISPSLFERFARRL